MKLEALGKMTFTDTKNNLVAELAFDNVLFILFTIRLNANQQIIFKGR
jgi:hypothetical protein